jgi:hypothetical protein
VICLPEGAHTPLGRHPCIPKQNRQRPSVTTPQRQTTEAADPGTAGDDQRRGLTMEKSDRIGGNLDEQVRRENTQLCSDRWMWRRRQGGDSTTRHLPALLQGAIEKPPPERFIKINYRQHQFYHHVGCLTLQNA